MNSGLLFLLLGIGAVFAFADFSTLHIVMKTHADLIFTNIGEIIDGLRILEDGEVVVILPGVTLADVPTIFAGDRSVGLPV